MSLENLLVDNGNLVVVIDFGMALLCPRGPDGGIAPMLPQGQCGKPNYMTPEVALNTEAFNGFAVDIWACGIILFM
ncbi:unnamed protein product [Discosporangium mesarthrocarpum]